MKGFAIATAVLLSSLAWADDTVVDQPVAAERVEAAQLQADMAWRELDDAKRLVNQAQQDLNEAEITNRQAQQQAQEAANNLQVARDQFAAAQEKQTQAEAVQEIALKKLNALWGNSAKPR
jgi:putative IMPACT (imprinted ancient) family translation regulator